MKKLKIKKKREIDYNRCPFCNKKLRDYEYLVAQPKDRINSCKCGAVLDFCPSCGNDTWVKNNKCKHNEEDCGYSGLFEKVQDED